jgi:hypothetical protein
MMPYVRDYKKERLAESQARKDRRNFVTRARRKLIKEGKVRVGDGTSLDHIKQKASGGKDSMSNIRIVDDNANYSRQPGRKGKNKGKIKPENRINGK